MCLKVLALKIDPIAVTTNHHTMPLIMGCVGGENIVSMVLKLLVQKTVQKAKLGSVQPNLPNRTDGQRRPNLSNAWTTVFSEKKGEMLMPLNKPSGNMYPWAWTWNPLAGECPHRCNYCYVRGKIAPWMKGMGNDKYYGEPRLISEELKTKLIVPKGYVVFVQSCGDLFAYGIEDSLIWPIIYIVKKYPRTDVLFQSKNPERFFDFNIPQNVILGTTLESNRDYKVSATAPTPKERYHVFYMLNHDRDFEGKKIYRLMLSLEPIFDFDLEEFVEWIHNIGPEFVSIGADSGHAHEIFPEPSPEKLQQLINELSKFTEVRLKENLSRILPNKNTARKQNENLVRKISNRKALKRMKMTEGWGWPSNSQKAHYFREGRSLCGKWLFLGALDQENDESPDNCTSCKKTLQKEKEKAKLKELQKGGKIEL